MKQGEVEAKKLHALEREAEKQLEQWAEDFRARLAASGGRIVAHLHDEIVVDVPRDKVCTFFLGDEPPVDWQPGALPATWKKGIL